MENLPYEVEQAVGGTTPLDIDFTTGDPAQVLGIDYAPAGRIKNEGGLYLVASITPLAKGSPFEKLIAPGDWYEWFYGVQKLSIGLAFWRDALQYILENSLDVIGATVTSGTIVEAWVPA